MKLSVLMAAYDEIGTIDATLKKIKKIKIPKEIIIVDDGSNDGTREYLENIDDPLIKVFFHKKNAGKGAAIKTALKNSNGDIAIIQDCDLEYDPEDYYELIKPIQEKKCKVVYGTRYPELIKMFNLSNRFFLANRILTNMSNILYRANITDEPTCYKVFDTKFIKSIPIKGNRFEWEPEVTAKILKRGHKIHEVPIKYYPRTIEEGKKINWKDGVQAIWTLIKYRLID